MKILYLIPARAGSKGLPNKNIKLLGGKPLFMYSVDFAKAILKPEDKICISTNDTQLIEIAKQEKIEIQFQRPDFLASDTASTYDVMLHAIDFFDERGIFFDALFLLQPTSPFRNNQDFNNIISTYETGCDMAVSVCLAKENPYFSLFEETNDGYLHQSKQADFTRRQDAPNVYSYNGSMYLINIQELKKKKLNQFTRIKKVEMPKERSIDIDTMEDWILAEYYLTKNIK